MIGNNFNIMLVFCCHFGCSCCGSFEVQFFNNLFSTFSLPSLEKKRRRLCCDSVLLSWSMCLTHVVLLRSRLSSSSMTKIEQNHDFCHLALVIIFNTHCKVWTLDHTRCLSRERTSCLYNNIESAIMFSECGYIYCSISCVGQVFIHSDYTQQIFIYST